MASGGISIRYRAPRCLQDAMQGRVGGRVLVHKGRLFGMRPAARNKAGPIARDGHAVQFGLSKGSVQSVAQLLSITARYHATLATHLLSFQKSIVYEWRALTFFTPTPSKRLCSHQATAISTTPKLERATVGNSTGASRGANEAALSCLGMKYILYGIVMQS